MNNLEGVNSCEPNILFHILPPILLKQNHSFTVNKSISKTLTKYTKLHSSSNNNKRNRGRCKTILKLHYTPSSAFQKPVCCQSLRKNGNRS